MPNLNDFNVWLFHWSKESFKIVVKTTHFLNFNSDTKKDTTKETTRLLISTDARILTKISAKDPLKNNNKEKGFQGRQNTFCRPRNCNLAAQSSSVGWVRGTEFLEGRLKWHLMWPIAWSWWLGNHHDALATWLGTGDYMKVILTQYYTRGHYWKEGATRRKLVY